MICPTSGKVRFKKLRWAQCEATRISRRRPWQGPPIAASAYRCTFCGNWHVGRNVKRLMQHFQQHEAQS